MVAVSDLGIQSLGENPPWSRGITVHYSFGFAWQVHLPNSPYQPGPLHFLTQRKVGIFGIYCEGLPLQVNYLIDEGTCCGKGLNVVIPYLHHFFATFRLGEKHLHVHCDNCAGKKQTQICSVVFCIEGDDWEAHFCDAQLRASWSHQIGSWLVSWPAEEEAQEEWGSQLLDNMPQEVLPQGISDRRQEYLFRYIRQFVRHEAKDILTPAPHPHGRRSTVCCE